VQREPPDALSPGQQVVPEAGHVVGVSAAALVAALTSGVGGGERLAAPGIAIAAAGAPAPAPRPAAPAARACGFRCRGA
jgi:hypothetical protein